MARRIPDEFESFYLSTRDQCFRALLVTVRSATEADDLLAEAYTRALAHWPRVNAHDAPAAWVVRTALNLHRDRWRRSRRSRRLLDRHIDGSAYVDAVDPVLFNAIRALPDRQREVVAFRVVLGLSAQQTAAELGIDPGTVGTHLRRGLSALRNTLSATEPSAQGGSS